MTWVTRDDGGSINFHINKPDGKIDGVWKEDCAYMTFDDFKNMFEPEFSLELGGGPLAVDLGIKMAVKPDAQAED